MFEEAVQGLASVTGTSGEAGEPTSYADELDGESAATAFGAVVFAPDGIRFHTAARTSAELFAVLASYVGGRARYQLWDDDAARVLHWLHRGAHYSAVTYYFATVGERWDKERLHLVMPADSRPAA